MDVKARSQAHGYRDDDCRKKSLVCFVDASIIKIGQPILVPETWVKDASL